MSGKNLVGLVLGVCVWGGGGGGGGHAHEKFPFQPQPVTLAFV